MADEFGSCLIDALLGRSPRTSFASCVFDVVVEYLDEFGSCNVDVDVGEDP